MEENTLWMDKYKPRKLEELTFHPNQTKLLTSLSENSEFPHLIFYGPDGAGKKTRVHCFLSKVYGEGIYKMNTINKELKLKSKNISYMVTSSNYHLEFCPSDVGNNDKFIISHVIKETSSFTQLDTESQKNFKVIVLLEADKMTKEAQSALRRTMEKYSENCRIIMIVNDLSAIIDPIRSRCFSLRIPSPTKDEIKKVLQHIKNIEKIDINETQINSIIEKHGKNVRECITCLQMTSLGNYNNRVYEPEYINIFNSINKQILREQSAKSLKEIRSLFMELLIHGFRASYIIYKMTSDIIDNNNIKEDIKKKVIEAGNLFDIRANNGMKDFIHLEAFAAKIMMFIAEDK
jgi:replication factor C subunit 3/5